MTQAAGSTPIGAIARYGLLVGPVLSMIDSSIVNVAVPSMARDFGTNGNAVDLGQIQWVVSG